MQPQRPATRKAPARAAEPRPRGTPASSAPDPEVAAVRRLLPDAGGGLPLVLLGVLGFVAGAIFEQATSGQPAARADDPGAPAIPNIPVVAPPPLAQPAVAPPGSPIVPPTPPVAPAITAPAGTPPAATEVTPAPAPAPAPAPTAAPAAGTPSAPVATTPPAAGAEAAPAPADGIQFLDSPRKVGRRDEAPKSPVGSDFARLLLALVLIGAGLLAWYFVRRRNQGLNLAGGRDQLQVLGTTHVGGRWLVALVRVPGRTLVVGASDKGLSLLSEIRDEGDDQLPALPDGLTRDAQGLLGAAPESSRGLADARAGGRAGAPFDNLLSEMLRGGGGAPYGPSTGSAPPAGDPPTRGNSSPLESPEARALRARLQRQQPSP